MWIDLEYTVPEIEFDNYCATHYRVCKVKNPRVTVFIDSSGVVDAQATSGTCSMAWTVHLPERLTPFWVKEVISIASEVSVP